MKTLIPLFVLLSTTFLFAQDQYAVLENSQIAVPIHNGNKLFQTSFNDAGFTIKAQGANTTFTSSLWLSGYDPVGNAFLSAETYSQQTTNYGLTGPINPETGVPYEDLVPVFNRFFEASQQEIGSFLDDFADGSIDDEIPANILSWPAVGNPFFQEIFNVELPNHLPGLAPFFDQNGDGIYDPESGDYPYIKDADHAFYYVYHLSDAPGQLISTTETEVQVLARIYEGQNSIGHTAFFDYKLVQTKFEELRNFRIAMFVDPDLGCYADDYLGYSESCEFMYAYNQDALDGTNQSDSCDGLPIPTFGSDIPIMAYSFIDKPTVFEDGALKELATDYFIAYHDGSPISSLPSTFEGYLQNLNGTWQDDIPITLGGTGLNIGSSDVTKYCFPGNPAEMEEWSSCSEDLPFSERRGLLGLETFTFPPGGVVEFTFAAFAHYGAELPCPDITETISVCEEIKAFNNTPVSTHSEDYVSDNCRLLSNVVSPAEKVRISCKSSMQNIQLFNSNGKLLRKMKLGENSFQAPNAKGIYFIQVSDEYGLRQSFKLMVQ